MQSNHIDIIIKIQSWYRGTRFRKRYVLEQCDVSELGIKIEELVSCIKQKFYELKTEYLKSTKTQNLKLEPGITEYITTNCIKNAERVSEGNSPIDIIVRDKGIGIDVSCLCLNNSKTNEKSMMQSFQSGNEMDVFFKEKKVNIMCSIFLEGN